MQKKYLFLMSLILIFAHGCGLNQYKLGNISNYDYSIAYDEGIPRSLEKKINSVFKPILNSDSRDVYKINITIHDRLPSPHLFYLSLIQKSPPTSPRLIC